MYLTLYTVRNVQSQKTTISSWQSNRSFSYRRKIKQSFIFAKRKLRKRILQLFCMSWENIDISMKRSPNILDKEHHMGRCPEQNLWIWGIRKAHKYVRKHSHYFWARYFFHEFSALVSTLETGKNTYRYEHNEGKKIKEKFSSLITTFAYFVLHF